MEKKERLKVIVDRNKEMRTKEISKMISEGGLGPTEYYEVEKVDGEKEKKEDKSD
ncbi:MAG TPA: hypothetical protein VK029_00230 [Pseudogracilibacillus sp.]|nr:hypothetical protein [Pseudogracilibacillus sp.]